MTLHSAKGLEFPSCSSSGWRTACSRTCARSASPTSSRRSAASPTSASPGPASGSTSPTPGAACSTARRSTTRRAGSSTRSPTHLVEHVGGVRVETSARANGGRRSARADGASPVHRNRDEIVERALRPNGPTPSGAEALGLRVGDDVRHAKFGEGVILDRGQGRQGRGHRALRRRRREAPAAELGPAREDLSQPTSALHGSGVTHFAYRSR